MFTRDTKKSKDVAFKSLKDLIHVESLELLLKNEKRQKLLSSIKNTIGLNESSFNNLALPLVHSLIKYCQSLPETSKYYAHLGGLVDYALNRAEASLHLVRHILVLDEDEKPTKEQEIWLYTLFSAAMLLGIGKLYTDYRVDMFDANGQYVKCWQPLLEDLSTVGDYYSFDLLRGDEIPFRNNITLLLARQIMPSAGFSWISSEPKVFAVWLALFQGDRDGAGVLSAILDRANDVIIQREISEYLAKHTNEGRAHRLSTFIDTKPDSTMNIEKIISAEFITWLTQGLESGKILINKVPMLMEVMPTGIVISPQLFDMFVQEHRKFKNKVAVQKAFLSWNEHLLTDSTKESIRLGKEEKQNDNSITINTSVLPDKVYIYNSKTDKIAKISSLDLIHNLQGYSAHNAEDLKVTLNHLSQKGTWVTPEEPVVGVLNVTARMV